ncbi:MAG: SAM-dependent methyltransferase [Chloroflexota bacterium]|nr:class I SAM-dependent methyltransferase [Chloroflexota bacterium]MBI5702648.1 class I SAM-dependent methyltransferase [Chloroflexota bacterium]
MNVLMLVVYGISLAYFALTLLWVLIPAFYGLPSKPTQPDRIRKALRLAGLKPGEVLYDLGAGDGRVLLIAAKEFGAKAVGLEVAPVQVAFVWLRILLGGLGERVQVRWANYYRADLSQADVVFIYATLRELMKLAPHLEKTLKAGTRLISIAADFPEWEPSLFDEESLIFVYEMPPRQGSLMTYLLKRAG